MIGFINLLVFVLLLVSFCVNITNKTPDTREKIQETIDIAKSANFKAIIFALIAIILEALALAADTFIGGLDTWVISIIFACILLAVSISLFIGLLISRDSISNLVNAELEKVEKRESECIARRKAMDEKNDAEAAAILAMIGHYDKVIPTDANENIGYKGWANAFYVNVSDKKIIAAGRLIDFSDLISCTIVDNGHVISTQTGTANSKTQADNGSVVGRAVVGGLIAGGAGAIIGGVTAKNNTTTQINTTTTTRTIHDYTIVINIKDILSPVCKIYCGKDEKTTNEIAGTLNAILQSL